MTSRVTIRRAGIDDVDAVARLINLAFEVERFFKRGDRTSPEGVRALPLRKTMDGRTAVRRLTSAL